MALTALTRHLSSRCSREIAPLAVILGARQHQGRRRDPIAKAMNYMVNHRVPLTRFLDNGLLRLDNNLSELELRREKVGAHNWLCCGSDDGARWNATAVSLIASCQLHGIEP